jgi:diadenosine tetraphosphate (Ap4A) HIT family hydrolase
MEDCIFCGMVAGKIPYHKVWEDDQHLAFLSIFPNTEGVTVVTPKKHLPSYFADIPDGELCSLVIAAKKVAKVLDAGLEDVGRTALVFEGFGVDHAHAKLYPMHGTKLKEWRPIEHRIDKYFDKYEGYVSSHDSPERASDEELAALAKKLRNE